MRTGKPASCALLSVMVTLTGAAACKRSPEAAAAPTAGRSPAAAPATLTAPSVAPNRVSKIGSAKEWNGRYIYEFSGGSNTAGTAVTVTYTLTLTPSSCLFTAEGYQTDESITCTARSRADGVDIAFKSYEDGRTTDRYGNAVYSSGDPLFALEEGGGKLITHWKGYPLPDDKRHAPGVYFIR